MSKKEEAAPPAPEKKRRGRSARDQGLSRERVVEAALALIDAKGYTSFSLRDVARELGVYPTAIYWYVASRDELLVEVITRALGDLVPPTLPPGRWREWLKELFHRYRSAVARHPNVAPLLGSQIISNASMNPVMVEAVLQTLLSAGFKSEELIHVYNTVITAMVGFVTLEFASHGADERDEWESRLRTRFEELERDAFPLLTANMTRMSNQAFIVRWKGGTNRALERSFDRYIDVVLDGLQKQLERDGEAER
ncbi:TetR/AcrR family transcriptional regulator C-terminal domain-containing protein [Caballeronia sp. NK8]|uniref:TetR/AcrR family transcriptional regulator n=1 Tax=Caballeronia sp. NK8 TaxID=140098 RepID=UPI001BB7B87E|nr:TetR/AcrR family transcriptional regulator [Caballeronia sp. NK8]BCQ26325.1 TetR/AcrR family transcriptional regulator C-terminal domain-containing protein [Caballeronia sp. NK8]